MRNILLLCAASLLVGCQTVPVTASFPEAPEALMRPCAALDVYEMDPNTNEVLPSELLKVIVGNYRKAHKCASEVKAWQDWYTKQKKIFDESQGKASSASK